MGLTVAEMQQAYGLIDSMDRHASRLEIGGTFEAIVPIQKTLNLHWWRLRRERKRAVASTVTNKTEDEMTTYFNSFDEAYCFLLENGFKTDYDNGKRYYYPDHCISAMTGASAGKWIVSVNL